MLSADTPLRTVCINCKLRKKKCDKIHPRCGYCTRKKLDCSYHSPNKKHLFPHPRPLLTTPHTLIQSSLLFSTSFSDVLLTEPKSVDSGLYLQVLRIIRTTGQFVDDVSARYFRGFHSFVPVISRPRFHDQLLQSGAPPPTGFSVLLLSMCLATYHPEIVAQTTESLDPGTLYVTAKTLLAQVQAATPPSLHLIQATTILAAYEYAIGKFQEAFATISLCARMSYAARLHLADPTHDMGHGAYLEAEEARNTWWGIIISERIFYCELGDFYQPLATRVPSRESSLPTEPALTNAPIRHSNPPLRDSASQTGGFACMAQATWFLDEVLSTIQNTDLDTRLRHLEKLDHALRTVLAMIMNQSGGEWGTYCSANAIFIRALFILHREIINQASCMTPCDQKPPHEWLKSSHAALDSLTKMMEDIVETQNELRLSDIDTLPPSCASVVQCALRHIDQGGDDGRWTEAKEKFQVSCGKFNHRWGFWH